MDTQIGNLQGKTKHSVDTDDPWCPAPVVCHTSHKKEKNGLSDESDGSGYQNDRGGRFCAPSPEDMAWCVWVDITGLASKRLNTRIEACLLEKVLEQKICSILPSLLALNREGCETYRTNGPMPLFPVKYA